MKLNIKNMVCDRCILVVSQQLEQLGYQVTEIQLGSVTIDPSPDLKSLDLIGLTLKPLGFELIDDEKSKLIELIKNAVIELVHYSDLTEHQQNIPELLSNKIHKDYSFLSKLFSESEGITIERYIIQQKIEKVKEFLEYGEININEIAYKMGYSSAAHLSSQFKSVTGISPSKYNTSLTERKSLDSI